MKSDKNNARLSLILLLGMLLGYFSGSAAAGCKINYSFQNDSDIESVTFDDFQVKSRGGTWRNIQPEHARVAIRNRDGAIRRVIDVAATKLLHPSEVFEGTFTATFNCSANRKYRIVVGGRNGACSKNIYYPSGTEWTTETDINFGDISQHCISPAQTANDSPSSAQPESQSDMGPDGGGETTPTTGASQSNTQAQSDSGVMSTTPGTGVIALPSANMTTAGQQIQTATIVAPALPEIATATTGQCLVTSSKNFPKIRLRCGASVRDTVTHVAEDYLADCPLVAGDMVNIQIAEDQREMQITGRASGGQWCNKVYQPGYYAGPCSTEKNGAQKITVKTYFYQGRKIVSSILPNTCKPARLEPGIYRIISEHRVTGGGQPTNQAVQEAGLRLEGQSLIGDVTGLLSAPIEQR